MNEFDQAILDWIRNYDTNRRDFYAALLPRIMFPRLRQLLSDTIAGDSEKPIPLSIPGRDRVTDEFVQRLGLRDILKKTGYGHMLGRTTISWEEALSRAEIIEETGALFFEALARCSPINSADYSQTAAHYRLRLGKLLVLEDSVRYRKVKLQEDS